MLRECTKLSSPVQLTNQTAAYYYASGADYYASGTDYYASGTDYYASGADYYASGADYYACGIYLAIIQFKLLFIKAPPTKWLDKNY